MLSGVGTGRAAAASDQLAHSAGGVRWPRAETTPCCARQTAGSTPHRLAAAAISSVRPTAPAWRSGVQKARTEDDRPVVWMCRIELAYSASLGGACSSRT